MKNNKYDKSHKSLNGKGFYIALCSSIALIAIIFYAGNTSSRISDDLTKNASDSIQVEDTTPKPQENYSVIQTQEPIIIPDKTVEPIDKSKSINPTKTVASNQTIEDNGTTPPTQGIETIPDFTMPVQGDIITTFSNGALIYNKDLDDWRAHNGIDIKADIGTEIKACSSGKIIETADSVLGKYIIIEHENGFKTMYANLDNTINVALNDTVKKGDVIGKIGNTSVSEQFIEPHLHLELYRDNKCINPTEWIK